MAEQKMTFEKLDAAMQDQGIKASPQTIEKLCYGYQNYCSKCSNPNVQNEQKMGCGCGGGKVKPQRRW